MPISNSLQALNYINLSSAETREIGEYLQLYKDQAFPPVASARSTHPLCSPGTGA